MKYQLQSNLKPFIQAVVEQKHQLGFSYYSGELILGRFDKYCASNFPEEKTITRDMGLGWAALGSSGKGNTNSLPPIRELARYMVRKGVDAYVIPNGVGTKSTAFHRILAAHQSQGR